MNRLEKTRSSKRSWYQLVAGLLLWTSQSIAFPHGVLAAGNLIDPANAYFFAVTSYGLTGLEHVSFRLVDSNEPDPPAVSLPSPADSQQTAGVASILVLFPEDAGVAKVQLFVNGRQSGEAVAAPYRFSWDTSPLALGDYALSVKAIGAAGTVLESDAVVVSLEQHVVPAAPVDSVAPLLTINALGAPTSARTRTITGTVSDNDAVAAVTVQVGVGAPVAASVSGNGWSFPVTGLPVGASQVSVRASDKSGNIATAGATIVVIEPEAPGVPTPVAEPLSIVDAQLALLIASGNLAPSMEQVQRLDVAPFVGGVSHPNGKVDTADVVVILLKIVGKL
jgi:chitinase